jgi:hypothetical protein
MGFVRINVIVLFDDMQSPSHLLNKYPEYGEAVIDNLLPSSYHPLLKETMPPFAGSTFI